MKAKLTDDLKETFRHAVNWINLELEYVKLTAAEKLVILLSTIVIGGMIAILMLPVLIMFLFALVGVFRLFMSPPLAYLTVGGIVLLLIFILFMMSIKSKHYKDRFTNLVFIIQPAISSYSESQNNIPDP